MADPQLELGRLLMTRAVATDVDTIQVMECVGRHLRGDYGDTPPEDCRLNVLAIREGCGRVMSNYQLPDGSRLWISTDGIGTPDHHTLAMRPSDY